MALNHAIISNNIISGSSSYTYAKNAYITADSTITDNMFSGITNNASTSVCLDIATDNSIITGNKFYRESNNILAYIRKGGSGGKHVITDNSFDNYTTDGSNENVVLFSSSSADTIYERNKNQISYISISPFVGHIQTSGAGLSTLLTTGSPYTLISNNLIYSVTAGSGQVFTTLYLNLSDKLPINSKILRIKNGIRALLGTSVILSWGSSDYKLELRYHNTSVENFTAVTGSILDLFSGTTAATAVTSTPSLTGTIDSTFVGNINVATQIIEIQNTNDNYINTKDKLLSLALKFNIEFDSGSEDFVISPIVIKYIYT
jgi:hypothetical protein